MKNKLIIRTLILTLFANPLNVFAESMANSNGIKIYSVFDENLSSNEVNYDNNSDYSIDNIENYEQYSLEEIIGSSEEDLSSFYRAKKLYPLL